jgi:lipoprotein-releasing system permease protein
MAGINQVLPPGWYTESWTQRHEQRFAAIRNERVMMYFLLSTIILVAAFSTMNTMITVTVQKRHEIGVMKALGARVSQIVWVFLLQGMIVGFIGAVAGLGLGMLTLAGRNSARAWLADNFNISIFSEQTYGISEIPAELVGTDVAVICIGAFVLCALAALPPAYMVARLDPAKALRD